MAIERAESQELQPTEFAVREVDIPPRRAGLRVFVLLVILAGGWYLITLLYIAWDTHSFRATVESRLLIDGDESTRYAFIERHIANHDEAQRRLWDSAERIELALVALLSAVVGY